MKQWLRSAPDKSPSQPEHVDIMKFNAKANAYEETGATLPKYIGYVRKHGPAMQVDEWGIPLPLSAMEQDLLNRLVAILTDPVERTKELLLSGLLNPDEVDAIKSVYPEIYSRFVDAAVLDMTETKPPFQLWAQTILGILFKKPANLMYAEEQQQQQQQQGAPSANSPQGGSGVNLPTQVDRREIAVRQQQGR